MGCSDPIARFASLLLAAPVLLVAACDSPHEPPAPAVHQVTVSPDSLVTLHRTSVTVEAFALDADGNPAEPAPAFAWSSSDAGVATVEAEPGAPWRAVVSTRGRGTATIRAAVGATAGEMQLHVPGEVSPAYRVTRTGLPHATALSDRGEVAAVTGNLSDTLRLWLWSEGGTTRRVLATGYVGGVAAAMNDFGIVVFLRPCCNTGLLGFGHSWVLRNGHSTGITSDYPGPSWNFVEARDVEEGGTVVGAIQGRGPPNRAFQWSEGQTTMLPVSDSSAWSMATAVNAWLQVAVNEGGGVRGPDAFTGRAFLWHDGEYTAIPSPSSECLGWIGVDINADGAILVTCGLLEQRARSFLWDGAGFTAIPPVMIGHSLNDRGEVVGWGPEGAYHWRGGVATRLMATQPGEGGLARINNAGQVLLSWRGAYLLDPVD